MPTGAELLEQLADLFNARQFDRLPELVAPDATFDDVAAGHVVHGIDGISAYMQAFARAFSNMRLDVIGVVGDGAAAAGEFIGSGTQDGPLAMPSGEIPATGRTMTERFVWYADVADGKLTGVRDYYNAMSMMTQLGLMG